MILVYHYSDCFVILLLFYVYNSSVLLFKYEHNLLFSAGSLQWVISFVMKNSCNEVCPQSPWRLLHLSASSFFYVEKLKAFPVYKIDHNNIISILYFFFTSRETIPNLFDLLQLWLSSYTASRQVVFLISRL